VYDLTVEGVPEFYANGILVHNCLDAGKMMAAAKRLAPLDEMLARDDRSDVLDIFMGA